MHITFQKNLSKRNCSFLLFLLDLWESHMRREIGLLGRLDHFTKLNLIWGGRIELVRIIQWWWKVFAALAALYLPNGLTEWVIIQDNTIQSDRRGNACTTGQMTSDFHNYNQVENYYEIRQPLLQIKLACVKLPTSKQKIPPDNEFLSKKWSVWIDGWQMDSPYKYCYCSYEWL